MSRSKEKIIRKLYKDVQSAKGNIPKKKKERKKKLLNMGSSTGQRPEGENQKKWLLVRPLEAQSRMLRGRLLERQCRPLQDPSTRKFTGREWMRSFGIKICKQGLRFISTQRKR